MAKQLNVSLNFSADTSQAKNQVQSLLAELNKLSSAGDLKNLSLTPKLTEAKMAAKQLETQLTQAFNVDTGQLDLNKLNSGLKKSGMTLADYGRQLSALGPTGDAAFLKIAQSIAETQVPLRKSNSLLREFGTTLMNTARWQISSSILHGFMGALSSAYGYAQDLNESLNNIRIVTGKSTEDMAQFAAQANKAAKNLSATTTEYTNASLIFYQQGLSDKEVEERTEVTIKMANAAGESAEKVSDQLTAVWNNFYDGSQSLEYYADVMTALGAATASSTDEIAGGLEKFAAIGETIGLSFEYAASALATITSNTRQSEEVVGTALKTIFARIQGLNLGETLDDGTTLNKYSEALQKVGISIFEQNGELKEMDDILNEMGSKWGDLSKAQQTALAQTVAGIRQYTQLIALMENWNNGDNDSMMANLSTSYESSGTLDEQAEIYAESWEASRDRVTAAMEGVYDSLLKDSFFIDLNNTLATSVEAIEKLVDSLGGMSGVLSVVGVLVTRIFSNQISDGINNALNNFKIFTGTAQNGMEALQAEAREYAQEMTAGLGDAPGVQAQNQHLQNTFIIQKQLKSAVRGVTEEQAKAAKEVANTALEYSEMAKKAGEAADQTERAFMSQKQKSIDTVGSGAAKSISESADLATGLGGRDLVKEAQQAAQTGDAMGGLSRQVINLNQAIREYNSLLNDPAATQEQVAASAENLRTRLAELEQGAKGVGEAYSAFQNALGSIAEAMVDAQYNFNALQTEVEEGKVSMVDLGGKIMSVAQEFQAAGIDLGTFSSVMESYEQVMKNGTEEEKAAALNALKEAFLNVKVSAEDVDKAILKQAKSTVSHQAALKGKEKAMKNDAKAARESATAIKNHSMVSEQAQKKINGLAQELEKAKSAAISFGTGVTTGLRAISSLAMGLNSLKGAWDTLQDPDMSTFDKITSVLMSMGFALPGLISGFKGLGTSIVQMKAGLGGSFTALMANALGLEATALATQHAEIEQVKYTGSVVAGVSAETANTLASIINTASKTMNKKATKELNEEEAKNSALTLSNIALRTMENMSLAGGTSAKIAHTAAQWALNGAMSPFVALVLAALAAMAPYIVAVGALALAIGGLVYVLDSENRALREAEEREQKAADSAKRVSEEINEINSSLTKIDSGKEALKNLEKGTSEWYQKLTEVNAEVQSIIEKYPELNSIGGVTMDENGMLGISDVGKEYISQQQIKQQATATNIQLQGEQNTLETQVENNWTGFGTKWSIDNTALLDTEAKAMVASYQKYGDAMFSNTEYMRAALENMQDALGAEYKASDYSDEEIKEYFAQQEEAIKEQSERLQKIDALDRQMMQNRMAAYGSKRTADQAYDLMGDQEFYSKENGKLSYTKNGNAEEFSMNKHFNYDEETMPQEIKDFMKLQGSDAKYVAQRNGKLVLEINDKEVSFTADEVYDALGELYGGEAFEEVLRTNLANTLSTAVESLEPLETYELIDLDNLYIGIEQSFDGMEGAEEKAKSTFNALVQAYTTTTNELGKEVKIPLADALAELSSDTHYIDVTGPEFQNQLKALEAGKITLDEFKSSVEELNALGQIDTMDSWFKDKADAMGLGEEEAKDMQNYAKHLIEVADELDYLSDELTGNADSAADLAVEITRMNKGIDTLADNFEDWNDILKKSSKGSAEYAKAMSSMKEAVADVLDVEADMLSSDFITKHSDDIQKAATGDAEAIDRLRASMDEEIIGQIKLARPDLTNLDTLDADVKSKLDQVLENLDVPDIEVGAILQDEEFLQAANKLVTESGMTADQANAYFAGIGYEPVYNSEELPDGNTMSMPNAVTSVAVTGVGWSQENFSIGDHEFPIKMPAIEIETRSTPLPPVKTDGPMTLTSFSGDETPPEIKGLRKKATGSQNNYSSKNPGGKSPGSGSKKSSNKGSSSKPKKADKVKKSDIVERYKEIDDSLDDVRDSYDDVNKAADRLYGAGRIAQMKKANAMIQEEIGLLKKKKAEAQQYLKLDKIALDNAAKQAGVSLSYDAKGNIVNYTAALTELYEELDAVVDAANADGNADEIEQEEIDKLQEKVDELKEAVDQYEETRELIEDIDNEIDDKFYEWQDNNAEMLSYKLEIQVDLQDDELRKLDYYLSKTEDSFYKRAEGAALMTEQVGVHTASLATYSAHLAELEAAYLSGQISQAAYVEGLDTLIDGLYGNLEAIQELDKEMMHYYGDTLEMAREEIDVITDSMEHQTSILEHYLTLIDLMGKSTDYDKVGIVLDGKAQTTKNEMIAAREEYEMFAREKDEMYMKWKSATNEAQAELYREQYEAALAASNEAQEEYLSKAEEYGEALRAILENNLNKYAQDLENALTGGTSFDQLTAKMERAASLQEEYLTTTNKIYETNKLMNQAQQQIDKTSNTVAKQRLKQFIDETAQLQQKNELSYFELEIQQAKYDLLLAEIALEEAQNAKSQVRLQRDAEGNFGYVYTADQSEVASAEQQLADAQNNLYNIALEGANSYTEKYQQILNEMYDTLTDLQQQYLEGAFESEEEYHAAVLAAKEYYFAKLEDYSELYQIAITTDSRVIEDAWSSDFQEMTSSTELWKTYVNDYVGEVRDAFDEWDSQMSELASEVGLGGDLSKLAGAVEDVTDESDKLLQELVGSGGLLSAIQQEIDAVSAVTDQYAALRESLLETAEAYEALAEAIMAMKQAEAMSVATPAAPPSQSSSPAPSTSSKPPAEKKDSGSGGDGVPRIGDTVTYTGGEYYHDSYGSSPAGRRGPGKKVKITYLNDGAPYPIHVESSDSAYGWLKKSQIQGYDTGGYTGTWGSYGKLAMLHEKELVLSAGDTENFLMSMELLDNIIQTIDLQAANSRFGGALNSPTFGSVGSEPLEQMVTIEANFPNVQSRTEIEEAFSTLVNRASQYANRK